MLTSAHPYPLQVVSPGALVVHHQA